VIGGVFAWLLGLGVFFPTLFTTRHSGAGNGSVTVLFGSIFGLSPGRAAATAIVAVAICLAVLALARPLLFASVDESVAAPTACRCGCSASPSWSWSPASRRRPPRWSARC
jgi:zinc/manganese transport system permease protein